MPPLREDDPYRACSVCGCTWDKACLDPATGLGCYWVGPHLCNVCQRAAPNICDSCDGNPKGKAKAS